DVEGPGADDVAPRRATGSLAKAAEQRPHDLKARPLVGDQLVRGVVALDPVTTDAPGAGALAVDPGPKRAQDLAHHADVLDIGDVIEDAFVARQETGGEGGVGRVLRATHPDVTGQRLLTLNNDL